MTFILGEAILSLSKDERWRLKDRNIKPIAPVRIPYPPVMPIYGQ